MQDKLQELTDRLYEEGLSKGRQEAEQLLARARKEAQEIVAKARDEAAAIQAAAEKKAAETQTMVEGDLKMASIQAVSALKQQVETMVVTQSVSRPVGAALSDGKFVRELIATVVKAFDAANPDGVDLEVLLPGGVRNTLEEAFDNEVIRNLSSGLEAKGVKGLANGFRIGPKDGGYRISFTADDFTDLIATYLRPATRKILFGK